MAPKQWYIQRHHDPPLSFLEICCSPSHSPQQHPFFLANSHVLAHPFAAFFLVLVGTRPYILLFFAPVLLLLASKFIASLPPYCLALLWCSLFSVADASDIATALSFLASSSAAPTPHRFALVGWGLGADLVVHHLCAKSTQAAARAPSTGSVQIGKGSSTGGAQSRSAGAPGTAAAQTEAAAQDPLVLGAAVLQCPSLLSQGPPSSAEGGAWPWEDGLLAVLKSTLRANEVCARCAARPCLCMCTVHFVL